MTRRTKCEACGGKLQYLNRVLICLTCERAALTGVPDSCEYTDDKICAYPEFRDCDCGCPFWDKAMELDD